MERKRIYLCLAHMSEAGLEKKYIQEAFDTNWVVPLGPNVNGFEKDLEDFVNGTSVETYGRTSLQTPLQKRVVALSAGTAAVHLGLIACGVGPGDEVIVQSFTFCASSHPITYLGAKPIFVDSEKDSWNIDPELMEKAIKDRIAKTGKKPKAIVPVALYGMPYDIDRIMEVANKYGIPVVEDAAEGFGSRWKGQVLGTFGEYGVLSFNGNKMITTSGGGALVCPNQEAWQKIMWLATQAREAYPYYQHEAVGYNYRMSNICAGIGRGQMTIVNDHIDHHKHVFELYKELLKDVKGIEVHAISGSTPLPSIRVFASKDRRTPIKLSSKVPWVVQRAWCMPLRTLTPTANPTTTWKPCAFGLTKELLKPVRCGNLCISSLSIRMHQPMSMVFLKLCLKWVCVCLLGLMSLMRMCGILWTASKKLFYNLL